MSYSRLDQKGAELSKLLQLKEKYNVERKALAIRVKELDLKLCEVEAQYAVIRNSCAPVLALPTEVTCMVFQFASSYPMEGDSTKGMIPWSEVNISHVCHRWRSISLGYPQLWANFCYDGVKTSFDPLDRFHAYLKRSAPLALDLWFNLREGCFENVSTLLERALLHVDRWKHVTVLTSEGYPLSAFFSKIEAVAAPNLEHLALRWNRDPLLLGSVKSLNPTIFTNGAPKLRSAILDWSSVACIPPLSNITSLRLETLTEFSVPSYSWSTFLTITKLPSLANLSLAGGVFHDPEMGMTDVITMTNLKHLRSFEFGLSYWLPYLRAPVLETLVIKHEWFGLEFVTSLEPYVFPALRSVSLIDTRPDSDEIAWHFSRMTASATEILFFQYRLSDTFLYVLQNSEEFLNQIYWTKVKVLACDLGNMDDKATFLRFVKAHPKNSLVRIFDDLHAYWKFDFGPEYTALAKICTIEIMDVEDNPFTQRWPPGEYSSGYLPNDKDPFGFTPY